MDGERKQYLIYIKQLFIDDKTAMLDGWLAQLCGRW
jgi:hypothetical protein